MGRIIWAEDQKKKTLETEAESLVREASREGDGGEENTEKCELTWMRRTNKTTES